MNASWKVRLPVAIAVALVGIALVESMQTRPVYADQTGGPAGPPRYSVVITEGHNLLVTDNGNNKIYFYTKDYDKPIGAPLVLRADLDLTQVGKPEIRITPHNLQKIAPPEEKK